MPLTDAQLRESIAKHRWTAQNFELAPGIETLPGSLEFLKNNAVVHAVARTLDLVLGPDLAGRRVADLGCLEGGHALAVALRGAETLGVEVRSDNIAKCTILEQHFDSLRLRFVQDDVKNFARATYGEFDAVLALGILYHLDDPVGWLAQIAGATKKVLVVETHYAPERDDALPLLRPVIQNLGPLETFRRGEDVYEGRWFYEFANEEERDGMPWASYSNRRSLWLTRRSILVALKRAGFAILYEQFDHWIERYEMIVREYPRSLFVAIRTEET